MKATVVVLRGDEVVAMRPLPPPAQCDLALVDRLARWQLAARRRGCTISLRDASADLVELIEWVGLDIPVSQAD